MESNGKSVRWDGSPVTTTPEEVFWGEPGTNGQHAFYQLIHQGTRLIPADFIAFVNPAYPLADDGRDVHGCSWPTSSRRPRPSRSARRRREVEAEGTTGALVAARTFPGNRPTTSIFAPSLTPSVLGQLIALYEHIVFTQGTIWGINPSTSGASSWASSSPCRSRPRSRATPTPWRLRMPRRARCWTTTAPTAVRDRGSPGSRGRFGGFFLRRIGPFVSAARGPVGAASAGGFPARVVGSEKDQLRCCFFARERRGRTDADSAVFRVSAHPPDAPRFHGPFR